MSLTHARLIATRACIAAHCSPDVVPDVLGEITLRSDQCRSAARVLAAIARDGGCLLADDVGKGKTFVALAVASRWTHPLLIVPASLRSMWRSTTLRTRVACTIISHESLSRGQVPSSSHDGIVVDESHRFRSTTARRYDMLVRVSARTPVLLLSATPLQNRLRDLSAQIALFIGSRAFAFSAPALARYVVRGREGASAELPRVAPPRWTRPAVDDGAVLRAILALPAPTRLLDGGDAGALRTLGLVRAWASSRAALESMLRRRLHAATAVEQCAESGRLPNRREVRAWLGDGGDVQLGLASLLADGPLERATAAEIAQAVHAEREGLDRVVRLLRASQDPDDARVAALRAIREEHAGVRLLAFSELASTVRAYYARMRRDGGIGMITARGGCITSGKLPRGELLARFAPRAQGVPEPSLRERVGLLLSTDLLSEGQNLQDAGVVVHLDLPWNPARLAQRVGRVRRPGGSEIVRTYLIAPPADTELLLDVERRLRRKLRQAETTIGRSLHVVPALSGEAVSSVDDDAGGSVGSATLLGEVAERVARWRCARSLTSRGRAYIAGALADRTGWLASLDDGRLLASLDGAAPDVAQSVPVAVRMADGDPRPASAREVAVALESAQRWLDAERLARWCGIEEARPAFDVALDRRIAAAVQHAARHERAGVVAIARQLREALLVPRSLGAEWELEALSVGARGQRVDRAWLEAALGIAQRSARSARSRATGAGRVVALVVFGESG